MNKIDSFLFYINILINSAKFIKAFVNNGYLCYAAFNKSMVRALKLPRIFISHKFLTLAEEDMEEKKISFITYANVDINGYKKRIFGYVIKKLAFPLILKDFWLKYNNVIYKARKR
jgi:CTP:phosphocholine cytidylyltransferase-like protein